MIRVARTRRPSDPGRLPEPGARAPELVDVVSGAEAAFRGLRVVVVGAGGIGGRIALELARGGVRDLLVVDGAELKAESLLTHAILPGDVGRPKAATMARRARALGRDLSVRYACASFQDLALDLLVDVDVVVLASDNLAAELAVAEACRRFGVRLVQASLYGPTLTAEVRSLGNADASGPCLACTWAAEDWARLDAGTRFACVGAARASSAPERQTVPTRTTAELCAVAAATAVAELRRRTFWPEDDPRGANLFDDLLLQWSGYTLSTVTSSVARSRTCAADHGRWDVEPARDLAARSPRELLQGVDALPEEASFELDGQRYCAEGSRAGRFVSLVERSDESESVDAWRDVPAEELELDVPLGELVARPAARFPAVVLRADGRAPRLFHVPGGALGPRHSHGDSR